MSRANIPPPLPPPTSFPSAQSRHKLFASAIKVSVPHNDEADGASSRASSSSSRSSGDSDASSVVLGDTLAFGGSPHRRTQQRGESSLMDASHVSFRLAHRRASVANTGGGGHSPPLSSHHHHAHHQSGSGNSNEVNALRNKVSELEYQLSKYVNGAGAGSGDVDDDQSHHAKLAGGVDGGDGAGNAHRSTASVKEVMDSIKLERDVAKRNCDILTSNVETLKALSIEMATQLDQTTTRCKTLEEKLKCSDLKKELHDFNGADAMRKLYEGRLSSLERSLKASAEANDALLKRFSEREVEQDVRVNTIEASKDALVLKLMRENASLKEALNAAQVNGRGAIVSASAIRSSTGAPAAAGNNNKHQSPKDILAQFKAERRDARQSGGSGGGGGGRAVAVCTSSSPPSFPSLADKILQLTVQSKNLVAIDAVGFGEGHDRRAQLLRGTYPPSPAYNQQKYHVDLQVDVRQLVAIDGVDFAQMKKERAQIAQRSSQWAVAASANGATSAYGADGRLIIPPSSVNDPLVDPSSLPIEPTKEWFFVTKPSAGAEAKGIRIAMETI